MINKLIRNGHKFFFFDLDKTIWNCHDKYGNEIWGKQMIVPFAQIPTNGQYDGNSIIDDVGSICQLQDGIREVLSILDEQQRIIGVCSASKNMNFEYQISQPCIQLLKAFFIDQYFSIYHLNWKTVCKANVLKNYEQCVLFDDNKQIIEECMQTENITPIARYNFQNWKEMLQ